MTQDELARRAGVSQPTISQYEKDPGLEHRAHVLFKIAAALGTSPEYLTKGTGPMNIDDLKASQAQLLATIVKLSESDQAVLLSVAKSMVKT